MTTKSPNKELLAVENIWLLPLGLLQIHSDRVYYTNEDTLMNEDDFIKKTHDSAVFCGVGGKS